MGLLDTNDPMLDLGMGLLAASGPSRMPVSLGQVLASGYGNMQASQERARRAKMEQEAFDLQKSYKAMQEQMMASQLAQAKRQQDMQERLMAALPGAMAGQPQVTGYQLNTAPDAGNVRIDPASESAVMQQAARLASKEKMGGKLTEDEKWLLDQVRSRVQPITQQGAPDANRLAMLGVQGELAGIKGAGGIYNYAKDFAKPDWQQIDSGGQIGFVNKNSGTMPTIQKTMTPGEIASNQLGWANNEVSRQNADIARFNAMKPTYHDGALVSPTGEVTRTPMYAPPKGSPEAQAQASAKMLPLLDQAERLLRGGATGSNAGAATDAVLGAVGVSTPGAQATAQLKALEGAVMMAQPRMEGPQSDKDVALYRQMAGQLGDSTVPVETRLAALAGIRALHEKYAGQNSAQPTATAPPIDYRNAAMEELRRRGIR